MMPMIVQWETIKGNFTDTLLLGNGASCALSDNFQYKSLLQRSIDNGFIGKNEEEIFSTLNSTNFEGVMKSINDSVLILKATKSRRRNIKAVLKRGKKIKDALSKSIHSVHDNLYATINDNLDSLKQFCASFKTIFSLNYDLTLYWTIMQATNNEDGCRAPIKDCFIRGAFRQDWQELRTPIHPCTHSTLAFYPHGNISLLTDTEGNEKKIIAQGDGMSLVETISREWNHFKNRPLFISEGDSESKKASIYRSRYLSTVLETILPEPKESITIYGWSMSDNDSHILDAICKSLPARIAISIRGSNNDDLIAKATTFEAKLQTHYARIGIALPEIIFFRSNDQGCWCY